MQKPRAVVVSDHMRLVEVALFVINPGEWTTVGALHQGIGLPVDSVGTVLEQGVAKVDEKKLGVVHPCGGPAQLLADPEKQWPVLRVGADLLGGATGS